MSVKEKTIWGLTQRRCENFTPKEQKLSTNRCERETWVSGIGQAEHFTKCKIYTTYRGVSEWETVVVQFGAGNKCLSEMKDRIIFNINEPTLDEVDCNACYIEWDFKTKQNQWLRVVKCCVSNTYERLRGRDWIVSWMCCWRGKWHFSDVREHLWRFGLKLRFRLQLKKKWLSLAFPVRQAGYQPPRTVCVYRRRNVAVEW